MWDTVDTTAAKSTHLPHEMSHVDEVSAASFGLFGRDDLLANLMDLMDHGGSAVVFGEPGIGKSSLLRVADQLAKRRGRRVLFVSPTQFDRGLPSAGLSELIAQFPTGVRYRPQPRPAGRPDHERSPARRMFLVLSLRQAGMSSRHRGW